MRFLPTFTLLAFTLNAWTQPGPIEQPLHVVVTLNHGLFRNGMMQYMVISPSAETLRAEQLSPAQGDSVLSFMVHASRADHPWRVKYLPGGAMMELHIDHIPSLFGFTLRVPFTQGNFELDSRRLMKCLSDQAEDLQRRDARQPGWNLEHPFGAVDTLACHGGLLVYSRGGTMHAEVRILDLMSFVKRTPHMPPTAAREASYPGGPANFDHFIRSHFSKPLIERTNTRVTLSALVTIESDGSIHRVHLNGSTYPELDREFKRVLQLSSWWEPASVQNLFGTLDPPNYRYVEHSKVIEFTVDPDSIRSEIPEAALTIMPKDPDQQRRAHRDLPLDRWLLWALRGLCQGAASPPGWRPARRVPVLRSAAGGALHGHQGAVLRLHHEGAPAGEVPLPADAAPQAQERPLYAGSVPRTICGGAVKHTSIERSQQQQYQAASGMRDACTLAYHPYKWPNVSFERHFWPLIDS